MDNSFVDLRLNHHAAQAEEGFWPSFTDIMTVILMIFMLAMVVLLIRNMELLDQLRSTMAAEQEAMELVKTTGEENQTLEERLLSREYELSMMRMQLMRSEEQQEAAIASQLHQISSLSRERDDLESNVTRLTHDKDDLNILVTRLTHDKDNLNVQVTRLTTDTNRLQLQIDDATRSIENLTEDMNRVSSRHALTQDELDSLRTSFRAQSEELAQAQAKNVDADQTLADLKIDFQALKIKYDKLVRPARTSRDKFVVVVRFAKIKGQLVIDYKAPGSESFKTVSRKQLDQSLTRLKAHKANQLYVKVIIPKNSGLSYNEAWTFTNQMHKKYDYYFQEDAKKERMINE
ncbi:MAG: hypothetical protein DIZ78_03095 [endosymbiont of Escarpia spicata]|uniref:Uncharacterized protein n=1 Tax=endosymbiont of Escarpia spicata TaxID=2200908 RepID=A0A370DR52_9GAMM|nr:MAG: hypothetical protein DIZ78_03095 [endosymbiont of Escarpia spicata]